MNQDIQASTDAVAIVGLAGRFPKARNLDEFWRNLRDGVETVSFFDDRDVQWLPIEHPPVLDDPRYVKARSVLEKPEWFDAAFFGMNPREAAIMDPQHRVFLECAWEALEDAGCNPDVYPGLIGVFAGASMNTYLLTNLLTNPEIVKDYGLFSSMIMNDGDFVPTRVSYKLNLRGPSINVQTACSTSLVAVCLAAQSILTYRCDVALAGGVSITFPPNRGQHHLEGGILSNDGHCRAFDASASGTVLGDGAGIVVLKRLSEALAEGDRIYAVIKGTAMNNDGAVKIGYTAPSVDGQAECIAMAQAEAGFEPESISYVEAHGTGTPLGDPIEIAGLTKAFGARPGGPKTCAIGSIKSNLGHLDIAAGVAGLIKTVLALQHEQIPPSLHFQSPNPKLELDQTPFVINHQLTPWKRGAKPRRAGVSSFGIGGTNAHVALEEAPPMDTSEPSTRHRHLLVWSAKTPEALDAATERLAEHLEVHPEQRLEDVAYSLQTRRRAFAHRRALVAASREEAIAALRSGSAAEVKAHGTDGGSASGAARIPQSAGHTLTSGQADGTPTVAFLFPGQGAQSVDMARELYEAEPRFRAVVDRCCAILQPKLGCDLRGVIFPTGARGDAPSALDQTRFTQPALFVIEYALARLWMDLGVKPNAMIGHSLGEYVAACLAGVWSLEDALAIVAERARLMQAQPAGAMLAIRLPEAGVLTLLGSHPNLSLAATNARGLCVVSGPFDAITALEKQLGESGVASRRLATSHAFHSAMMEGAVRPLVEFVRRFPARAPQIPFVSNVSGRWITAEQATDPEYWARHLREAVRFADGVGLLAEEGAKRVLLEVGPGETLAGLARQSVTGARGDAVIVASLGRRQGGASEQAALLRAVGQLWTVGVAIDWKAIYAGEERRFVALPTYAWQRKRYWIEPGIDFAAAMAGSGARPARAAGVGERDERKFEDRPLLPAGAGQEAQSNDGARAALANGSLPAVRALFTELSGSDLATADPDASFYELGFDSLFLTQASQAVSRRFAADVTFRQLREQLSSLARLAAHLDAQAGARDSAESMAAIPDRDVGTAPEQMPRRLPLTEAQREIWYASQLGHEVSAAYNESSKIRLRGSLDLEALQRAFRRLIERHEALRITILPGGEGQTIAPPDRRDLPVRDLTSLEETTRAARVRELIAAELERPFDLQKGPLFRAHLLRVAPDQHLLVFVVHHIVCDGWSLGILQKDLGELYGQELASADGRNASAKNAGACGAGSTSFAAYAAKLAGARDSAAYQAAEDYWSSQFSDEVPVLDLPADRPRPSERTFAGASLLRTLPAELTAELKALSARHECTMFATLLAAFNVLLCRLSGQNDLVVGIPAAAQVMDGCDDLVGHFANLLPVRNRVDDQQPFAEFLSAVRGRLFESVEHWRFPFGQLLRKLNVARDGSRMPIANVVFNSTRLRGTLPFGPLAGEVEGNAKRFSHFDLNVNFAVTGDTISIGGYYSTELFDEATVARWFQHFETLLRGIVATPEAKIADLPLLTEAERRQILVEWNRATVPYDRNAIISELFEAQVARTPDAVAVVGELERLTYRELNARADRLASRLRQAGVGTETLVGVFLERSPQLIVAILGILKAGGAYVPLDPAYPTERLEFIVGDARMPTIVTQATLVPALPAGGFDFVLVDDERPSASRLSRSAKTTPARPTPDNLGYVIYTSGSTGRPKGVAVEQRGVALLVEWARQTYRPEELDGLFFSTSACFDVSVFEMFCPLCLGGKIIVAENILQLASHPAAGEVRFISGVPSAVAEVVRLKVIPPSVTTVNLAGELASQTLVDALYALPHVERVFDHYGPTETTVYSIGGLRSPNGRATIGRPFPNEQVYILDRNRQPVPIGVKGEIFIAGDKLAREYLNRPELTAERFVPGSQSLDFQASDSRSRGRRLYRTGDVGRWCADGTIEACGRLDHQVKIRGYRIELGEVETALRSQAEVADAIVIARPDSAGNNRLLAYVLAQSGVHPDVPRLREYLRRTLPDYMIPSGIMVLERWPLNPNGKLDRQALPEIDRADAPGTAYVAPGTTTEELLADIWREVLGVGRVGVHDNFFELGGHSLLATQVIARVHEALEVDISMRQLFAAPSIAALAVVIEGALIRQITDSVGAQPSGDVLVPAKP